MSRVPHLGKSAQSFRQLLQHRRQLYRSETIATRVDHEQRKVIRVEPGIDAAPSLVADHEEADDEHQCHGHRDLKADEQVPDAEASEGERRYLRPTAQE